MPGSSFQQQKHCSFLQMTSCSHLETSGSFSDHLRQGEETVDDVFGDDICRSCFGTEDTYQRSGRCVSGFDLQILMDQEQKIQLLAFVLVKSFGLDRKHCICVQLDSLFVQQAMRQAASLLCFLISCELLDSTFWYHLYKPGVFSVHEASFLNPSADQIFNFTGQMPGCISEASVGR